MYVVLKFLSCVQFQYQTASIRKLLVRWCTNVAGDMDVEDMSMEDITALMSEVELTATVVETNYKPITDEDGDSLFRECQ